MLTEALHLARCMHCVQALADGIGITGLRITWLGRWWCCFQTPHATGHKFNGWVDQFLGTPNDSLQDIYLRVGGKISAVEGLTAKACYHTFSGDDSGDDFGTELDIVATYKFECRKTDCWR